MCFENPKVDLLLQMTAVYYFLVCKLNCYPAMLLGAGPEIPGVAFGYAVASRRQ
jgi:hypothetical protein